MGSKAELPRAPGRGPTIGSPNRWPLIPGGILCFCFSLFLSTTGPAQDLALQAGQVIPVVGDPIEKGRVLIQDGRITAIGPEVAVPEGIEILDFSRGVAMPGFVDAHTFLSGYYEREETVESYTPEMHLVDLFNPAEPWLAEHLAGGVTTALIAPGNGNVVGGQTAVVKLAGAAWKQQILREVAGLKFCFTAEALRPDRYPTSRFGLFDLVYQQLQSARRGLREGEGRGGKGKEGESRKLREGEGREGEGPAGPLAGREVAAEHAADIPSLRQKVLQRVLRGELRVQMQAVEAHEIMSAVRIAEEFKLSAVLLHADRAYQVVKPLARHGLGVVCGPLRWSEETLILENPGRLAAAGIPIAFCSDAPLTDGNSLRRTAVLARLHGLDTPTAWRALTLNAAEFLGVADRVGSLEVGKDGDLVVFSGDPLDLTSRVERVVIQGRVVYPREGGGE